MGYIAQVRMPSPLCSRVGLCRKKKQISPKMLDKIVLHNVNCKGKVVFLCLINYGGVKVQLHHSWRR
jgi:hypothetical protein